MLIKKLETDTQVKGSLLILPKILATYLDLKMNSSVYDTFLMFINQSLKLKLLTQTDIQVCNLFDTLKKLVSQSHNCSI